MEGHVFAGLVVNGPLGGEFLTHHQPTYMVATTPEAIVSPPTNVEPGRPISTWWLTYEHIEDRTGKGRHSWRLRP